MMRRGFKLDVTAPEGTRYRFCYLAAYGRLQAYRGEMDEGGVFRPEWEHVDEIRADFDRRADAGPYIGQFLASSPYPDSREFPKERAR